MTGDRDAGYVTVLLPFLVIVAAFATVVLLDVTAYFVAGMRAQTAADMAALAAVAPSDGLFDGGPSRRAAEVADGYGAVVTRCDCGVFAATMTVEVRVAVAARALPHLGGAQHVVAVAQATVTGA